MKILEKNPLVKCEYLSYVFDGNRFRSPELRAIPENFMKSFDTREVSKFLDKLQGLYLKTDPDLAKGIAKMNKDAEGFPLWNRFLASLPFKHFCRHATQALQEDEYEDDDLYEDLNDSLIKNFIFPSLPPNLSEYFTDPDRFVFKDGIATEEHFAYVLLDVYDDEWYLVTQDAVYALDETEDCSVCLLDIPVTGHPLLATSFMDKYYYYDGARQFQLGWHCKTYVWCVNYAILVPQDEEVIVNGYVYNWTYNDQRRFDSGYDGDLLNIDTREPIGYYMPVHLSPSENGIIGYEESSEYISFERSS